MADETLRMQAEVVDRFSGPLKSLRAQLLDTSRQGASHGEALAKGLNKAEAAAQATANTAKTVLNPALAAIGVTGLGTGVAVAGIVASLNSLGSNLSSLGALGRETGMAADQLRIFQSVASKFGVSGDASSAAAKTFSQNMRDIRRGVGETMGFLQSQNPVVAQFALKLKGTTNNDEALKMAEEFLEQIPNAVDRGRFAEKLFGNMDLGRLGDRHLGAIRDLNAKAAEKLGPLDPKTVESAERYERALDSLRSSMQRIGTAIAVELMEPAERFATWVDEIASGHRKDLIDGLRQSIRDIGVELGKVDWVAAGKSAEQGLKEAGETVKSLAVGVKEVAAAIGYMREGEAAQVGRSLDGASGPLARRLAPRVGDDDIDAQENVERLRKLRDLSNEAAGHLIGRTQQRMGLMDTPEVAQRKLDAAEAELERLKARTPEQRQKDFESSEKLRRSIDGLSETIKGQQQGATKQNSSAEGGGPFAGARVQTAGYGGARLYGGGGGLGGGSGPGYSGEQGERDAMRERFREHLKKTVPGYMGGDTVPLAPGSRVPEVGRSGAFPGVSSGGSGGDGQVTVHGHRWRPGASSAAGKARVSSWLQFFQAPVGQGGLGADAGTARAMVAMMQGESGANLDPTAKGDYKDPSRRIGPTAFGTAQWRLERFDALKRMAAQMGTDWTDVGAQQQHFRNEVLNGRYQGVWKGILGAPSEEAKLRRGIEGFERPKYPGKAFDFRKPNLDILRRRGAGDEEGRMPSLADPQGGGADGEGWAAREKARKSFEAMQQGEGRLDASAGRAGVVGGQKVEANGSVYVQVHKPGPDTNVRTSASGNLFKDVVLSRGRTMAPAERT
jgi:hypothetical protein